MFSWAAQKPIEFERDFFERDLLKDVYCDRPGQKQEEDHPM